MAHEASECIFCRLAAGDLDTEFLVETDNVVAFNDLAPQAPSHALVVPKAHLTSLADVGPDHSPLLTEMMAVANQVARDRGIDRGGYRVLTNVGPDAGQTIFHLHWHVLGGRELGPLA